MKKLAITLILVLVLQACSAAPSPEKAEGLHVVTTSFPLYDFVREIGGSDVHVELLLHPGAEVHTFEPTPADLKKVIESDLFLYVGGESDQWINNMLDSTQLKEDQSLMFMDKVKTLEEEQSESMVEEHDHDHGHDDDDDHDEYDEHVWLSFDNAKKMVNLISAKLQEMDGEHAAQFKEREESYLKELDSLEKDYQEAIANGKRKEIIVGDRFPFLYLVRSLGLTYDAAYPGCSANVEENAQTIKSLIDKVKAQNIPVVFHIEMSSERITDRIVEATGAKKSMLHSIQNISKEEMDAGENYVSLMKKNLDALKEALN